MKKIFQLALIASAMLSGAAMADTTLVINDSTPGTPITINYQICTFSQDPTKPDETCGHVTATTVQIKAASEIILEANQHLKISDAHISDADSLAEGYFGKHCTADASQVTVLSTYHTNRITCRVESTREARF